MTVKCLKHKIYLSTLEVDFESRSFTDDPELKNPFGNKTVQTQPNRIPTRMAIAIRDPGNCLILSLRPDIATGKRKRRRSDQTDKTLSSSVIKIIKSFMES